MPEKPTDTKVRLEAMLFFLDKASEYIAEARALTNEALALSEKAGFPPLPDAAFAQLLVALPVKSNIEAARVASATGLDPSEYLSIQLDMYRTLGIDTQAADHTMH